MLFYFTCADPTYIFRMFVSFRYVAPKLKCIGYICIGLCYACDLRALQIVVMKKKRQKLVCGSCVHQWSFRNKRVKAPQRPIALYLTAVTITHSTQMEWSRILLCWQLFPVSPVRNERELGGTVAQADKAPHLRATLPEGTQVSSLA